MFEIVLDFDDNILIDDIAKGRQESFAIWLQCDNYQYPVEGWYDNGIILLSWWTTSWESLLKNQNNQGIAFMEGPYHLSIRKAARGTINLVDSDRKINFDVRIEELGKQLRKAVNAVIRKYEQLNLDTDNLKMMRKCLGVLDEGLKDLGKLKDF